MRRGDQSHFLGELAERAVDRRLAGLDPAARQRPLARVRAETRGAPGEQKTGGVVGVGDQRHRDRRVPPAVERYGEALMRREVVAHPRLEIWTEGRERHHLQS